MEVRYEERPPHPALAPFVECTWTLSASAVEATRDRVLPDGCAELIVNRGDRFVRHASGASELQPRTLVAGQIRGALELEPTGAIDLVGARFRSAGAARFVDVPQIELTGRTPSLDEVAPRFARAVEGAADVRALERVLVERLRETSLRTPAARASHALALAASERLVAADGALSIDALASELGVGTRRLERAFRRWVGLSPKELASTLRFQRVFGLAEAAQPRALAEIALDGGYHDQAHFSREFRRFAGESATRVLERAAEWARYFVRARRAVGFVQDAPRP